MLPKKVKVFIGYVMVIVIVLFSIRLILSYDVNRFRNAWINDEVKQLLYIDPQMTIYVIEYYETIDETYLYVEYLPSNEEDIRFVLNTFRSNHRVTSITESMYPEIMDAYRMAIEDYSRKITFTHNDIQTLISRLQEELDTA